MTTTATHILLVDDDDLVLRSLGTLLRRNGFRVTPCASAVEASGVPTSEVDVIVCDISMPELSGMEFLRQVRQRDADVPVLLMTGAPSVDTAMSAIELGVSHYLSKPVESKAFVSAIERAARLGALAKLKRRAFSIMHEQHEAQVDRRTLDGVFSTALEQSWSAFQPIVSWGEQRVFGYEALLRTDEPTIASCARMLETAEKLERWPELGRVNRARIARESAALPPGLKLFVNLHASDLNDAELYSRDAPLSAIADRVVLEITERASLEQVCELGNGVRRLRELGFEIAIDDLGAGYAGLTSFTQLDPQIVKLDMSLIRGIDRDPKRLEIVRSMTTLCKQLNVRVVAEGIETVEERDVVHSIGVDFQQGFLFARPQRDFILPAW